MASGVALQRTVTDACVDAAGGIVKKRRLTEGGVESARGIVKKRPRAHCRIFISGIVEKRSRANGGVEAAGGDAVERSITSGRVETAAAAQVQKGIFPLCSIPCAISGRAISSVRRRADRSDSLRGRDVSKQRHNN